MEEVYDRMRVRWVGMVEMIDEHEGGGGQDAHGKDAEGRWAWWGSSWS